VWTHLRKDEPEGGMERCTGRKWGEVDKSLLIRSWLLRQRERFEGSAGVVIIILQHL
jgi:hypothetical protein